MATPKSRCTYTFLEPMWCYGSSCRGGTRTGQPSVKRSGRRQLAACWRHQPPSRWRPRFKHCTSRWIFIHSHSKLVYLPLASRASPRQLCDSSRVLFGASRPAQRSVLRVLSSDPRLIRHPATLRRHKRLTKLWLHHGVSPPHLPDQQRPHRAVGRCRLACLCVAVFAGLRPPRRRRSCCPPSGKAGLGSTRYSSCHLQDPRLLLWPAKSEGGGGAAALGAAACRPSGVCTLWAAPRLAPGQRAHRRGPCVRGGSPARGRVGSPVHAPLQEALRWVRVLGTRVGGGALAWEVAPRQRHLRQRPRLCSGTVSQPSAPLPPPPAAGRYGYDSLDAIVPPAATKPRPPSPPVAAAAIPAPRAPSPAPASRAPFATTPEAQQAQGQPDGGWGSEPEWLREAALAAAADAAVASGKPARGPGGSTKLAHLFSRDRSGENSSNSAGSGGTPPKRQARKAAASPQRQRGGGAHDKPLRAPAFGESALTKWH